jgi:hypothetical protein
MAKYYDIDTAVRIGGDLTVSGVYKIDNGSGQILTTGQISGGSFAGNGSGLTNLNSSAMPDVLKLDGSRGMTGSLTVGGLIEENGQLLQNKYALQNTVISVGSGLTGGGDLSTDLTLGIVFGTDANSAAVGNHNHNATYLGINAKAADSEKLDNLDSSQFLRSDANDVMTGTLDAYAVGSSENGCYVAFPRGGSHASTSSAVTGAIKITLPNTWTSTMMRFVVDIFDYATNESFTVHVSGYTYSNGGGSTWVNPSAYILGNNINRDFTVRFGHDGTKCCIYIGELASAWAYPQIRVKDFIGGFGSFGFATWDDGWAVGFETTAFGSVSVTISDCMVKSGYAKDAGKLNNVAASDYLRVSQSGQSISGNFTILGDGDIWVGSTVSGGSTGGGQVVVRDVAGINRIQLGGTKLTNVNAFVDVNGSATFEGTVSANAIAVTSTLMVNGLNAQFLNGITEDGYAKVVSAYELGGHGVMTGLGVTAQAVPNLTVLISGGTVYTNSGKRFNVAQANQAVNGPSATYNRIDAIYIQPTSAGVNEGKIGYTAGTASASPTPPAIPMGAVLLALVTVRQNTGSILSSDVSDAREYKKMYFDGISSIVISSGNTLKTNKISPATATATSIEITEPIKAIAWAKSNTIPAGQTSVTWTHNLGLGTSYVVTFSTDNPKRHVTWSSKASNSIVFNIDDVDTVATIVDAVITDV